MRSVPLSSKSASITLLVLAEIAGLSLWFASAAILPDMVRESGIDAVRQAMLSSGVQLGFVAGALAVASSGLADRFDPRRVFALCGVLAALCNAALLIAPIGGTVAILLRFLTGLLLAGVYPVGMKIAVGWGTKDRGLLVGLLVGALTVGSALPHLAAYLGGADWRGVIVATSVLALIGGLLVLPCGLGPHHARAPPLVGVALSGGGGAGGPGRGGGPRPRPRPRRARGGGRRRGARSAARPHGPRARAAAPPARGRPDRATEPEEAERASPPTLR